MHFIFLLSNLGLLMERGISRGQGKV